MNQILLNSPGNIILKDIVLYIGSDSDIEICTYIEDNYQIIYNELEKRNLTFLYYPKIGDKEINKLLENLVPSLNYQVPDFYNFYNFIQKIILEKNTQLFYSFIFDLLQIERFEGSGFIKSNYHKLFNKENSYEAVIFQNGKLPRSEEKVFIPFFNSTTNNVNVISYDIDSYPAYSRRESYTKEEPKKYDAEYEFENEIITLTNSIRRNLSIVSQQSHREDILDLFKRINNQLSNPLFIAENKAVSRLLINEWGKIMLIDFYNMEIVMTPLSKTLFLFYLNHPEGVMLSDLVNHIHELKTIYERVTNSSDKNEIEMRINDLVDVTKNSINEKCSRVKEAFMSKIDDNIAKNYYIYGRRGEPKRIVLDRSLVSNKFYN